MTQSGLIETVTPTLNFNNFEKGRKMSEIIRWAIALGFFAALWGMAAFLIYKQVPGWGWFLFGVILITGSTSIKIDSDHCDCEEDQVSSMAKDQELRSDPIEAKIESVESKN